LQVDCQANGSKKMTNVIDGGWSSRRILFHFPEKNECIRPVFEYENSLSLVSVKMKGYTIKFNIQSALLPVSRS